MPFLGTLINAAVIVIFSLLGSLLKRGVPERISRALFYAISIAVVFLGLEKGTEKDFRRAGPSGPFLE